MVTLISVAKQVTAEFSHSTASTDALLAAHVDFVVKILGQNVEQQMILSFPVFLNRKVLLNM